AGRDEVPVPDRAVLAGLTVPEVDDPRALIVRALGAGDLHGVVLAGGLGVVLGLMLRDVVDQAHGNELGLSSKELEGILRRGHLLPDRTAALVTGPLSDLVVVGLGNAVRAEPTEVLMLLGQLDAGRHDSA